MSNTVEFEGRTFTHDHGGPFDRGSADSYYHREMSPHYYPNGTGNAPRIEEAALSAEQLYEYLAGYRYNEQFGSKK